jgi:hypothetical protein
MRLTKRWSRTATACTAGAIALGIGTVAAQSTGDPWWYDVFQTGPLFAQSERGEVRVAFNTVFGFHMMSGNLGRARQEFPKTGEYIGCQVFTDPNDGQFLTCAARDAAGNTLECTTIYVESTFLLREHMMLNAAVNLTDTHYIAVPVDPITGECLSMQVMAASADFLGKGEPPDPGCTEANSIDLGVFGGSPVSVRNDACVKVTQFAPWPYGPNRTMQLQNPTGGGYPIPFEYEQTCTGASGSGRFDHNFDDQFLPGMSDACTLFIKLRGSGNGNISLRYW